MKSCCIDYAETNSFSDAVIRYLENDPKLKPFISARPTLADFKTIINERKTVDRKVLVETLTAQYGPLTSKIPSATARNIELLNNENTFTVTTGHQLNIFTGPLYFVYKIVTAINLAKELKQAYPDKEFVPVYWMATEDNDFAEINHTFIDGKKVKWELEAKGATGRLKLDNFRQVLKEYKSVLGVSINAQKLSKTISEAYSQNNLADATRYLVNELFGKYGLVVIDADDTNLKKRFSSIIFQDITQQNSFRLISETITDLQEAGINPQVNPREINFFYLTENSRERIVSENNVYKVLETGHSFTREELETESRKHPERFSPNVVMRPLYQEIILPNIAYIGGGAEIVYWLELRNTFDHYKIDFPVLVLRNSAMIVDEKIKKKSERLNLTLKDFFANTDDLKKLWIGKNSDKKLDLSSESQQMADVFEQIKARLSKIDQTLVPSTEAVNTRLQKAINNLEKKVIKAEKRNHADAMNQIETIKSLLFPDNGLQERIENFGSFYVKYGENFIDELVAHFKPLDFKFTILS